MTPNEFAARAVGVPWRRWRADWQGMDCYGLVILYFREVFGVELGAVPQTDIAAGFSGISGWQQCERASPGSVGFMTWLNGAPTHCGIVMPCGALLHAQEGREAPEMGSVRVSRMAVMERACKDLRFYRYTSA